MAKPFTEKLLTPRRQSNFEKSAEALTIVTPWPFIFYLRSNFLLVKSACCEGGWAWDEGDLEKSCLSCKKSVPVSPNAHPRIGEYRSWIDETHGQREQLTPWIAPFVNFLEAIVLASQVDDELVTIRTKLGW